MYRCSNCGNMMTQPLDRCPSCRVILSGVRCEACYYVGGKIEFVNNHHRCPKCNSMVTIPGAPRSTFPNRPGQPYTPGMGLAVTGLVLTLLNAVFSFICIVSLPICLFVAFKTKERNARRVAYVSIGLHIVMIIAVPILLNLAVSL